MGWHDLWFERETGRLRCWWCVLAFLAVGTLSTAVLFVFLLMPLRAMLTPDLTQVPIGGAVIMLILFCAAATAASILTGIWALRTFERLPAYTLGLAAHGPWKGLTLGGFGAGLGLVAVLGVILCLTGAATFTANTLTANEWATFALVSVAVLLGAVTFETVIHGYIFQTLLRGASPLMALLIVGILAVVMLNPGDRGFSLIGPANLLVLCILLGLLYLRSGSLWASLGLMAGWCYGFFILHLPVIGVPLTVATPLRLHLASSSWFIDPAYGPFGGVIASVILLAVLAILAYSRRGLPLESHWWEWRQLAPPQEQALTWDFSIGARYYQWKLLARDRSES